MLVSAILRSKGRDVHTIRPEALISDAVALLKENGIGALVVSADGMAIDGIISERDIVYGLAEDDEVFLQRSVSEIMVRDVVTCRLEDSGRGVLSYMTERRCRHLPVVEEEKLVGLISIGDVVKSRLEEIMHEADALREYISQA